MRLLASALVILSLATFAAPPRGLAATLPAPPALPAADVESRVAHDGARIWFATYGTGTPADRPPVILLHPGAASSDLWGWQVPALLADHRRVIVIDSRGHGRSTWDGRLSYALMESDVIAVMDAAGVDRADVVGWSDGAIVALTVAIKDPRRVRRIYAFGANMDLNGFRLLGGFAPVLGAARQLLAGDYALISPTPGGFGRLARAVRAMQAREPHYATRDLAAIAGPTIAIADGAHEEFIRRAHTDYLARTIPGAELVILPGAGHFAPLQAADAFNASMLGFLDG